MSLPDRDKQKASIGREFIKFGELMPSVNPAQPPIKKTLVLIDGSLKSRAAVLLAGEINRFFGTKIDVICFYADHKEAPLLPKESYEVSLAFAYEHLKSEDFEIKGQVLEDISALKQILDAILKTEEHDLIIVPSSFIGIKKTILQQAEDDSEAQVSILGDIFDYLNEGNIVPLLLVQSEKVNIELLLKRTGILVNSYTNLRVCVEKAIQYSDKKAYIHAIININPSHHEDLSSEEFEALIKKQKEEMDIFSRANTEIFKKVSRFIDFNLLSTNKISEVKELIISFGKDLGIFIMYLPSKHALLYGLFIDMLEDPDIIFPVLIIKKITEKEKQKMEELEEEKEEGEKEEIDSLTEEVKEELIKEIKKELTKEKKEEPKKELKKEVAKALKERNSIETLKESIIEEIKEDIVDEIVYELRYELKEPKKKLKEKVKKEIKEEAAKGLLKVYEETSEEDEEEKRPSDFE